MEVKFCAKPTSLHGQTPKGIPFTKVIKNTIMSEARISLKSSEVCVVHRLGLRMDSVDKQFLFCGNNENDSILESQRLDGST